MSKLTIAENAKRDPDELAAGVIENIVTTNHMFDVIPVFSVEDDNARKPLRWRAWIQRVLLRFFY